MMWNRIPFLASVFLLASVAAYAPCAGADNKDALNRAAEDVAQNIARLNLHKIYVPDFLDISGLRTDRSAFCGATFSETLSKHARKFEVVDRVAARESYDALRIRPDDLQKQEALLNIARANGADAIVYGTVTVSDHSLRVNLFVREVGEGKDLYQTQYQQLRNPGEDSRFPSLPDPSGLFFNFPGFDRVTQPKCLQCPNPSYTDQARREKYQGTVLLSAIFTAQGSVEQIVILQSPGLGLDNASIQAVRSWKIAPARSASGVPVSVRVPVEVAFRLYQGRQ